MTIYLKGVIETTNTEDVDIAWDKFLDILTENNYSFTGICFEKDELPDDWDDDDWDEVEEDDEE